MRTNGATLPGESRTHFSRAELVTDLAVVIAMVACVIAIGAYAPSSTYRYAQLQQMGAVVGTVHALCDPPGTERDEKYGNWLLPRDQMGGLARKPQLYAWLDAVVLILTGIYNDFTFRFPTVAAAFVAAVLVYFLGRRWHGRAVGLLAACLWVCIHHMGKLMYVAVTDVMLTVWITASIMCADRLLFHPAPPGRRRWWAVGLWLTMILAAMTKGWGVVNLVLVGLTLALALAVGPGLGIFRGAGGRMRDIFRSARRRSDLSATGKSRFGRICFGWAAAFSFAARTSAVSLVRARLDRRLLVAARLTLRRWWRAMKKTHFGWGILAMAAVLGPVWWGMFRVGGEEFREIVRFEFIGRITGRGKVVPHGASAPAIAYLIYYMMPVTVFAIGAMVLVRPRRWFAKGSATFLPLCWIVAVVLPFSLTHGFRPDYLLPCYAAGAIMGAWAIEQVRIRARGGARVASSLRHVFAAVAIVVSLGAALLAAAYLAYERMPGLVTKSLKMPAGDTMCTATWYVLAALLPLGLAGVATAIWASLSWRLRTVAAVAVVAMLAVMFLDRHMITTAAKTGDGERMLQFAAAARQRVRGDQFAVYRAEKLGTELYLSRFGRRIGGPDSYASCTGRGLGAGRAARSHARQAIEALAAGGCRWLVTCDRGLVELGAYEPGRQGDFELETADGTDARFRTHPGCFGRVALLTKPILSQQWGRIYLIRLAPDAISEALRREEIWRQALWTGHMSAREEGDD
ncbi:MAG: ArnT family glycosyltransferase [Planctomycetota bacterium]|jgi:4-amino-4-deoxy-L-arabinose transferase-like glycosyltransferase